MASGTGEIYRIVVIEYAVECCNCIDQYVTDNYFQGDFYKKDAIKEFKKMGWVDSMDGWTCPKCMEEARDNATNIFREVLSESD